MGGYQDTIWVVFGHMMVMEKSWTVKDLRNPTVYESSQGKVIFVVAVPSFCVYMYSLNFCHGLIQRSKMSTVSSSEKRS